MCKLRACPLLSTTTTAFDLRRRGGALLKPASAAVRSWPLNNGGATEETREIISVTIIKSLNLSQLENRHASSTPKRPQCWAADRHPPAPLDPGLSLASLPLRGKGVTTTRRKKRRRRGTGLIWLKLSRRRHQRWRPQ